jgi:hypothetical protein
MASAAGVAGVRARLDLGSKSSKFVQCGESDSARITHKREVGRARFVSRFQLPVCRPSSRNPVERRKLAGPFSFPAIPACDSILVTHRFAGPAHRATTRPAIPSNRSAKRPFWRTGLVLDYLGRYRHQATISSECLLALHKGQSSFNRVHPPLLIHTTRPRMIPA